MIYTATDSAPGMGTTTLMFTIVVSPPAVANFQAALTARRHADQTDMGFDCRSVGL